METVSSVGGYTVEDTAKRFQAYLRKYENDEKLVVLEAANKPGTKLGECYTSLVIRTTITGTRGDGSPYYKNFMWKMLSTTRPAACYLDLSLLFINEGHIYSKVLPVVGSYGPVCIYNDEENIIMEDLADQGYVKYPRGEFLDSGHIILALKALAKFHASSLALKIHDPRRFEEIATPVQETIYVEGPKSQIRMWNSKCIKWTIEYAKLIEPQTQGLQIVTDILTRLKGSNVDIFKRLFCGPRQKYHTICHCDLWINNMLFSYDDNGTLTDLKIVDYQQCRYTSVALDAMFLIYSSAQSSLIENSYESLVKIYHSTLLEELRRLHVGEEVLAELGEKWLKAEMKVYAYYVLMNSSLTLQAILASDEILEMFETSRSINFELTSCPATKEKLDRLNCLFSHYYKRFYLGIIDDDLEPLYEVRRIEV